MASAPASSRKRPFELSEVHRRYLAAFERSLRDPQDAGAEQEMGALLDLMCAEQEAAVRERTNRRFDQEEGR